MVAQRPRRRPSDAGPFARSCFATSRPIDAGRRGSPRGGGGAWRRLVGVAAAHTSASLGFRRPSTSCGAASSASLFFTK